jgi:hypothetical protein
MIYSPRLVFSKPFTIILRSSLRNGRLIFKNLTLEVLITSINYKKFCSFKVLVMIVLLANFKTSAGANLTPNQRIHFLR